MKCIILFLACAVACTSIHAGTVGNDDFANRSAVVGALPQTTTVVNLADASEEPLEPVMGYIDYGESDVRSAWWSWTALATGWVEISITGDPAVVSVYEGAALDRLEARQATGGLGHHALWYAEAGHSYHLRMAGNGMSSATLAVPSISPERSLTLDFSGPLPMHLTSWGIAPLNVSDLPQAAWFQGETPPSEEGTWVCPHDGVFVIEVLSQSPAPTVNLFDWPTLSFGTGSDGAVWAAFEAKAGDSIRMGSHRGSRARERREFTLREITLPAAAPDEVSGPLPLQVSRAAGSRMVAVNVVPGYNTIWQDILWTATADGPVVVRAAAGQTASIVYQDNPVAEVKQQHSADEQMLYFTAQAGMRYRISGRPKALEAWQITIETTTPDTHDEWSTAQDAGPADGPLLVGSTLFATTSQQERDLFGYNPFVTRLIVWGSWTATATGDYMLWQDAPYMQRKICVLVNGVPAEVPTIYPVPGDDRLTAFPAAAGTTYYFAFAPTYSSNQFHSFETPWHWNVRPFTHYPGNVLVRSLPAVRQLQDSAHIPYINTTVNWEWTCPWSGNYAFSTTGTTAVFQRPNVSDPEAPVTVATCPLRGFSQFSAAAGTTYIFRQTTGSNSHYDIQLRPCDYTAPNTSVAAVDLGSGLAVHSQAIDARLGHGVWWKWTAPASGVYTIPLSIMMFENQVNVSLPDQTYVTAPLLVVKDGDRQVQALEATAGQRYYFSMYPSKDGSGRVELRLRKATPERPANDDFANATVLRSERAVNWVGPGHGEITRWQSMVEFPLATEDIIISSLEPNEPAHAMNLGAAAMGSLWWQWTAPRTEAMNVYGLPTITHVYTGNALAGLTTVPVQSLPNGYQFNATAGTTYYLASVRDRQLPTLGEYSSFPAANTLEFTLYPASSAGSDAFADRIPVMPAGYANWPNSYLFQPDGIVFPPSTVEPGEPSPPTVDGQPLGSRWFTWTCEQTGFYQFYGSATGYNTRCYTGSTLATLVENPLSSSDAFAAVAGHEYVLARYTGAGIEGPDDGKFALFHHHPYGTWIEQFAWQKTSDLAMDANPSKDGINNLIKFLCGLDPSLPLSADPKRDQAPQLLRNEMGQMEFRFRIEAANLQLADSCYNGGGRLQRSADLEHWEDINAMSMDVGDGYTHLILDPPADSGPLFYRVHFTVTYDP